MPSCHVAGGRRGVRKDRMFALGRVLHPQFVVPRPVPPVSGGQRPQGRSCLCAAGPAELQCCRRSRAILSLPTPQSTLLLVDGSAKQSETLPVLLQARVTISWFVHICMFAVFFQRCTWCKHASPVFFEHLRICTRYIYYV